MAVTLTSIAAERVQKFLDARGSGVGLRISVRTTGCSGFAYVVDFAECVEEEDHVYDTNGVQVVVDAKSLPLVDGTKVDFARKGLSEGFQFDNPNVKGECGCGESFAV
jgi:iron-sulfur cluster assembly protein